MINITNMMMISTKLKNFTAATIPTKVTDHCHQLVRITSDCPGELVVGRGVRQLLLGQCSALSRSPW